MLKTTTSVVDGREIKDYLDVVVGEAILGANIFKDIFGAVRDVVGGRAGSYEREMAKARKVAFEDMEKQARSLGPTASSVSISITKSLVSRAA